MEWPEVRTFEVGYWLTVIRATRTGVQIGMLYVNGQMSERCFQLFQASILVSK